MAPGLLWLCSSGQGSDLSGPQSAPCKKNRATNFQVRALLGGQSMREPRPWWACVPLCSDEPLMRKEISMEWFCLFPSSPTNSVGSHCPFLTRQQLPNDQISRPFKPSDREKSALQGPALAPLKPVLWSCSPHPTGARGSLREQRWEQVPRASPTVHSQWGWVGFPT